MANRSRRMRFTLRFLTLLVLFNAVAFAWFSWEVRRNRARVAAIKAFGQRGAMISFVMLGVDESLVDPFGNPFGDTVAADSEDDPFTSTSQTTNAEDSSANPFVGVSFAKLMDEVDNQAIDQEVEILDEEPSQFAMADPFNGPNDPFLGLTASSGEATWFSRLCHWMGEPAPISVSNIRLSSPIGLWTEQELEAWSLFPELKSLDLHDCEISPRVLKSLGNLDNLSSLNIGFSQSKTTRVNLAELGSLEQLSLLSLTGVELDDQNLVRVANWDLSCLSLENVVVTATDATLANAKFPHLELLTLDGVTGNELTELPSFPELTELRISRNCKSLDLLQRTPRLVNLDLSGANLTQSDFKKLSWVSNLSSLDLSHAKIDSQTLGTISQTVPDLTSLTLISTNTISDDSMIDIAKLKKLQILDVSNTNMGDAGLREIWDLKDLQMLLVDETKVSQEVRDEFFETHPDCSETLFICGCCFGG